MNFSFACELCNSKFRRGHHLKKHVRTGGHLEKVEQLREEGKQVNFNFNYLLFQSIHDTVKKY